jgi:cell division protein FtsL
MSHLTTIILAVLITSWFAFSIYLYSILIEVKESEGQIQEHLKEYDDIEWDCEEIKKAV